MKLLNCKYNEIEEKFNNKRLIIYGIGDYFTYYVAEHLPNKLRDQVQYFVDKRTDTTSVSAWGSKYEVHCSDRLRNEKDCIVLIASSNNMLNMYEQLNEYKLPDSIECYSFGLIMAASCGDEDESIRDIFRDSSREERIPRIIHTFWFSGDEKPEEYQRCINSWRKYCPNYEIKEWNCDNYDYKKSAFASEAIKCRKWAFAADYARLDVIWEYGGIYLDADFELLRPLDEVLGNKAFFTFDSSNDIDLCMVASEPHNKLIKELKELYGELNFSSDSVSKLCQPRFIRPAIKRHGIRLDGAMQMCDGNIFLTRNYFSPLDNFTYEMLDDGWRPYGIHHCNAGWRNDGFRKTRIENNRRLIRMAEQ